MDYGMDDLDMFDDQPSAFARWAAPALIISILLHVLGLGLLSHYSFFDGFAEQAQEPSAVTFKLDRVAIDPKLLEPRVEGKKKPAAAPEAVKPPDDKPSFAGMMSQNPGAPAAPEIQDPILAEKPKIDPASFQETVQAAQNGGVTSVASELDQVRTEVEMDHPTSSQPLLDMVKPGPDTGGSPSTTGPLAGAATPGFSNLDDLLAETGPLTEETAPIRMDSDVLYTYDSFLLQPQAVESLAKLGQIIQKNPQLDFTIEGHSDSDGNPTYNQLLSEQRADAVKQWLVEVMHVDGSRVSTRGFGSSRLVVPATRPFNEEQEAPNRRVEIVLHDRSPPPQ